MTKPSAWATSFPRTVATTSTSTTASRRPSTSGRSTRTRRAYPAPRRRGPRTAQRRRVLATISQMVAWVSRVNAADFHPDLVRTGERDAVDVRVGDAGRPRCLARSMRPDVQPPQCRLPEISHVFDPVNTPCSLASARPCSTTSATITRQAHREGERADHRPHRPAASRRVLLDRVSRPIGSAKPSCSVIWWQYVAVESADSSTSPSASSRFSRSIAMSAASSPRRSLEIGRPARVSDPLVPQRRRHRVRTRVDRVVHVGLGSRSRTWSDRESRSPVAPEVTVTWHCFRSRRTHGPRPTRTVSMPLS